MSSHILLVEDNPVNTRLFCKVLINRGHKVICAGTVDEGKARLADELADVVLLDIQIPGGGGESLLKHIRSTPALAKIPVIAVTALAMQGDRERLMDAGFDGYISKPINTREFGPQIEAMMKERSGPAKSPVSKKVLIIDDDPRFRALVVPLLEHRGCVVSQAATGAEGDAAWAAASPDLVIVDYHLPDTMGTTWIEALRQRGSVAKVMLISSFWRDLKGLRPLIQSLKISQLVQKPVIPLVLAELVEKLLGAAPEKREKVDLERHLATLRATYAKELPGQLAELTRSILAARKDPEEAMFLTEARSNVHKLLGTAGSYGFFELGHAIERIDALFRAHETRVPAAAWAEIDAALADMERAPALDQATMTGPSIVHHGRVLIVDANPASLRTLVALGRRALWDVISAASHDEAVEAARAFPPDVAVIDPIVDGTNTWVNLPRALRALPGCEALPFAFIPTHDNLGDRVAAAHLGSSMYSPKPIDPGLLVSTVEQLLSLKKAEQPRVLVVDDDEDFCALMRALLERSGNLVSTLSDATRVLEQLEAQRPELMLLDLTMPGVSGFDICRILRSTPQWRDLPIVFLSARAEADTRVAAFRVGGDDFITKPIVAEELLGRVRNLVQRARLLRDRAEKDSLTGILLRRAFVERVTAHLSEARRRSRPLTVGLLDLDHFKKINDSRGHLTGDRVLATFGKLLTRRFRAEDLRGRWGGEEFAVAFYEEEASTIQGVLACFLEEFSAMTFEDDRGDSFQTSFSAGVASFPEDGMNLEELIRVADARLYSAKKLGRKRVLATD